MNLRCRNCDREFINYGDGYIVSRHLSINNFDKHIDYSIDIICCNCISYTTIYGFFRDIDEMHMFEKDISSILDMPYNAPISAKTPPKGHPADVF